MWNFQLQGAHKPPKIVHKIMTMCVFLYFSRKRSHEIHDILKGDYEITKSIEKGWFRSTNSKWDNLLQMDMTDKQQMETAQMQRQAWQRLHKLGKKNQRRGEELRHWGGQRVHILMYTAPEPQGNHPRFSKTLPLSHKESSFIQQTICEACCVPSNEEKNVHQKWVFTTVT